MFPSLNAIEIQNPIVDIEDIETNESELFIPSRQSHRISENWNAQVVAALELASHVDPYQSDIPIGTVIPAAQAVGWVSGQRSCDIRPRLVDKSSGTSRLIDTGSQVSTTVKSPLDKKDKISRLVAVNGTKINTYGVREISVKIGRKAYKVNAVVCDVGQDILGFDFLDKYKLSMQWDDFDQTELYIVDRKASIKAPLQMVTVPPDLPRNVAAGSSANPGAAGSSANPTNPSTVAAINQAIAFQVSCVKKLESESKPEKKSVEEQLNNIPARGPILFRLMNSVH